MSVMKFDSKAIQGLVKVYLLVILKKLQLKFYILNLPILSSVLCFIYSVHT